MTSEGQTTWHGRNGDRWVYAWVIERYFGLTLHYFAPGNGNGDWTPDHAKACRFARREDAEAIRARYYPGAVMDTHVCEHGWG